MPDLRSAVHDYVATQTPSTVPGVEHVRSRATRRRRRTGALGVGLALVALAAGGVAWQRVHHEPTTAALPPTVTHGRAQTPRPALTVRLEGSRYAAYALPSLARFARSGLIDRVVIGTVTATRSYVARDGSGTVMTRMTVTIDPSAGRPSEVITIREVGGVVRLRDVRSGIEAHGGTIPMPGSTT